MANRETRLIRAATLVGYAQAASAAGLDPEDMLRRVGLNPRLLYEPDRIFSFDSWLELLALSAAMSGCADFGMRTAIARGIPDLGAVSLLMREAENVEAAIQFYTSHLALHSDGTFIQLDKRFENPIIVMEIRGETREQSIQATQFCVVGVTTQIRWLIGEDFQPELVCFSHPKPSNARAAPRFFNCPISYNQVVSGIVVDRAILSKPLVTSQPFLRKLAMQQMQPILRRPANGFAMRVTRLVRQLLEDGGCSSDQVASCLQIDRRTLNRRLEREGETFSSVLQQVRIETTMRGIDNPHCSLTELADAAGFQSLSSFSRWFQSTFGCTASQWRRRSEDAPRMPDARGGPTPGASRWAEPDNAAH